MFSVFDILSDFNVVNKNSFPSLVDIRLGTLFARYKDACVVVKYFKIRNIWLVFYLSFFRIEFPIEIPCEK